MSDAEVPGGRRDFFDALADPLREGIRTGALPPGIFLPSEAELARAARTKRHSIRRALCRLREQGMIAPVAGRGWVVVGADSGASAGYRLPRYRQIAAELYAAIEAGQLASGAALPSEAELVARHAVSRGTVRQALGYLEAAGWIRTRVGKGRYVC